VCLFGTLAAVIMLVRHPDAVAREGGRLWLFHGESDTSPHSMPGARLEDRHVIDADSEPRGPANL
jgi:hypothetical protein